MCPPIVVCLANTPDLWQQRNTVATKRIPLQILIGRVTSKTPVCITFPFPCLLTLAIHFSYSASGTNSLLTVLIPHIQPAHGATLITPGAHPQSNPHNHPSPLEASLTYIPSPTSP